MTIKDETVLDRFRAMPCEWCHRAGPSDPHHLWSKNGGRLDCTFAVASLCRWDHSRHHNGERPNLDDLLDIVALREKTTRSVIIEAVMNLRSRDKSGVCVRPMELSRTARKLVNRAMKGKP